MAGTKEILCSTTMDTFNSKYLLRNYYNFSHHQRQKYSLSHSTSLFNSCKRRIVQLRKVVAAAAVPMATQLIQLDSIMAIPAIPVQLAVTALVTVKYDAKENMKELMFHWWNSGANTAQRGVFLQLVSTDVDPRTGEPKVSKDAILDWSRDINMNADKVSHEVQFLVDANFGVPGAVLVSNKNQKEFYLESIIIEGLVHFKCHSWVQPEKLHPEKRIFFSNKAFLPSETPIGLKELRKKELRQLRGNEEGVRALSDRIYDYDVYNDLGNPDKGTEYARPILGGQHRPYPRRCRTGRPSTKSDPKSEAPANESMPMYVPRDESFGDVKRQTVDAGSWKGMVNNFFPFLKDSSTKGEVINSFSDINELYKENPFNESDWQESRKNTRFPVKLNKMIKDSTSDAFKFNPPKIVSRDASCCLRDDEFGRLTLAGMNPISIERLKVFPPVSKLDPSIYGPQESAFREEHIICHLDGMSINQAIEENKLFILDYHDTYFPFVNSINAHPDRKAYATRTIFFLTQMGTLKPIAIELSLPPINPYTPSKQVFTPPVDATTCWQWQLAKAHVCSNDSGAHELIQHWLRTHACMEPFIISARRHLSVMHPIHKLLHPHMRYTMEINARARELLISAGGIIESLFSTKECSMEITSFAYKNWRFDMESLPADLIRRGIAEADPTEPHGLKLLIEDYPYANDGLLIWSAIEKLVRDFVKYYYPDSSSVRSDPELSAWYYESINVGHADIRHESWWPRLSTPEDLVSILTTIIWIASAEHAALNFGQYHYGGYVPVRPSYMRRLVPNEHDPEYATFLADPEGYFLSSLPSLREMTFLMSVLDILSTHSPDEEYLGERKDLAAWAGEPEIIEAFYRFSMDMRMVEKEIEKRNANPKLRNRCGAGVSPYELLVPSSGPGVTCRGVPNSISI
ncbi:linoleate 13S-lipoxygenase 3-1, chloroplastic-like isoform X2 [Durio zibethinus]|uniref:Lipoxygenase n=1 Tax=Durio zibethinus TaxID=66656 RepID=A0A6P5WIU1_DURZI|nr:linoleate 13S-lipoxygenase 3-1, chloroplastic-like isoform X2 [Durio zibethinus]